MSERTASHSRPFCKFIRKTSSILCSILQIIILFLPIHRLVNFIAHAAISPDGLSLPLPACKCGASLAATGNAGPPGPFLQQHGLSPTRYLQPAGTAKTKVRTEISKVRIVFPKVLTVFSKVLTVFRAPETDGAQHRRDETRQTKKAVQTPCALHSLRFLHPPVLPGRRPEGTLAG